MSDDEQKKDAVEETPKDESAEAAGPDAASEEPAGGDSVPVLDPSESTPPAEDSSDAPADEAEAPAAEKSEAAEGSDAPTADASEEDELPWKEKRRLQKSRRPHKAGPQLSPEERTAQRVEARKRKAGLRRNERAAAKAKKTAGTGTPAAERSPNAAKVRQGIVVSDKGEKSITVRIDIARRHPVYEKVVRRSHTLHAHDERNEAGEGDVVKVVETRPLSKTKRWRLIEVLEKAK